MGQLEIGGTVIEVDENGCLVDFSQWNPEIAAGLAQAAGLPELNGTHLAVIRFIQQNYFKGRIVTKRMVVHQNNISMRELYQLFPDKPVRMAARIAGIPMQDFFESCL